MGGEGVEGGGEGEAKDSHVCKHLRNCCRCLYCFFAPSPPHNACASRLCVCMSQCDLEAYAWPSSSAAIVQHEHGVGLAY